MYCPICLDNITANLSSAVTCSHTFHNACIKTWKIHGGRNCPMCRINMVPLPYSLFEKLIYLCKINR